ncbi:MAG: undecaprenyldiphospho-muramoylpentapeptide beta-N-acetylglucosaminyltransferase [Thermodesulfobacteriota bacterium]|nr:undecaprenyldiphospho-muramoylpentapeptide beta-N-acetylglucosaminyltransferase [Thermodesulfobacteriota bacterium]
MIGKRKNIDFQGPGVIITGGGTGGHLFPGIAIAQCFREQWPDVRVLFVSAGTPIEKQIIPSLGFDFERIASEGIKGRSLTSRIRAMAKLMLGVGTAVRILMKFKPAIVVGMGGYSSAPMVLCAWIFGIRIVLHEQNAQPGITNRMLARFADCVFVSYEGAKDRLYARKIRTTGNPLRREIINAIDEAWQVGKERDQKNDGRFRVFVIGGSQGAHSLNKTVIDAAAKVSIKGTLSVVHQTGRTDEAMVRQAYERTGIDATVKPFFDDMAVQYRDADLIICRAGATTVAEIACVGKPAVFVPFPHAADNHQAYNARELVEAGAAEMIAEADLSGDLMAEKIDFYAARPELLTRMGERARKAGRPEAGRAIIGHCLDLMASPPRKRAVFYTCI